MFNRNVISSTIINILLIAYWCEISLVNCEELLKFWDPDPELNSARRYVEGHKYRNKNYISEKPFLTLRGKSIDNKYDELSEFGNRQFRSKLNHKSDKNDRNHNKNHVSEKRGRFNSEETHYTRDTKSKHGHDMLRTRGFIDEIKYKPKHLRDKGRRDSLPYESTRMTPMFLMQAEGSTQTTTTQHDEHYKYKFTPYAIAEQLLEISEEFPDVNVTQEIIGRTVEYNDIVLLKISARQSEVGKYFRAKETKYTDDAQDKKIIFIVHGLSVMGMANLPCLSETEDFFMLLSYYFAHLDKFDIFLIPMANPDGYISSWDEIGESLGSHYFLTVVSGDVAYGGKHTKPRRELALKCCCRNTPEGAWRQIFNLRVVASQKNIWNKNMSPQNACLGVALDRNFEVAWNGTRDMSSCSQLYPGPSAFSEAETRAVRDVFHHYSHRIIAYFHVHAGTFNSETFKGDAILYPKGYTDLQTDDDKYIDLKGEVEEAMKNASFQTISVTVDTLFNWYTKVSGTSVDYASTVYGIPYALELVMQIYSNYKHETDRDYDFDRLALTEIWKRLIDVIFNNIWRNTHLNNDNK